MVMQWIRLKRVKVPGYKRESVANTMIVENSLAPSADVTPIVVVLVVV